VSPTGDIPTERIARELAPLARIDPDAARSLWDEISGDGDSLTAETVREIVHDRMAGLPDGLSTFSPVDVDTQPRLDRRRTIICPGCGHEFFASR
jgi:hypothetical protein